MTLDRVLWAVLGSALFIVGVLLTGYYDTLSTRITTAQDTANECMRAIVAHSTVYAHTGAQVSIDAHRREVEASFTAHEQVHAQIDARVRRLETLQDERLDRERAR